MIQNDIARAVIARPIEATVESAPTEEAAGAAIAQLPIPLPAVGSESVQMPQKAVAAPSLRLSSTVVAVASRASSALY